MPGTIPTLYNISVPVITNALNTASAILKKGEQHAKEKGIPIKDLLESRIHDDMLPLSWQIVILANTAKKAVGTLTGTAPGLVEGKAEDKSIEELYSIIDTTKAELAAVNKEVVNVVSDIGAKIPFKMGPTDYKADAVSYIQGYTIPNVFFHLTILYALLRAKGVPLGKVDYLVEYVRDFER